MYPIILFVKVHANSQLNAVRSVLSQTLKDLKVKTEIDTTPYGWIRVSLTGEDEKAAANYLSKTIGLAPANVEALGKFSSVKGYISNLDDIRGSISVDFGLLSHEPFYATIPLSHLQAQLADGRKIALRKIADLYGLCRNLPLAVKILEPDVKANCAEAMISNEQMDQYHRWIRSMLDRLIVLGCMHDRIEKALSSVQSTRDVVSIEQLGLFEHAVVCKLGTDAAGLIPKLGRILKGSSFTVLSARKVLDFLGLDFSQSAFS